MEFIVNTVRSVLNYLGPWALGPIFLVVALESSAFFGLFFPGEAVAFIAGALAGAQVVSPWAAFATVAAGAAIGDIAGYFLGRLRGPAVLAKSSLSRRAYERSRPWLESHFQRWGAATVLVCRFVAIGRAFAPFTAGLSGMSARSFIAMAVVSAALWSAVVVGLGYLLGSNWQTVGGWLASLGLGMIVLLVLAALMVAAYEWLVSRQDKLIAWWQDSVTKPLAKRYGVDFSSFMDFIRERFSPTGYLGLHLTLGLLVTTVLMWLFGGIVQDVFAQDPLVRVDRIVAVIIANFHNPTFDAVMSGAGFLTNPLCLFAIVALVAVGLIAVSDRTLALVAIPLEGGAYGLALGLRALFSNFSPHVSSAALVHGFGGFPSVSMAAATAAYGFVWFAIMLHTRSWRLQMLVTVITVYFVLIAGLESLYRGQVLSAVGAGFALGGAWMTVCATGVVTYERLRAAAGPDITKRCDKPKRRQSCP